MQRWRRLAEQHAVADGGRGEARGSAGATIVCRENQLQNKDTMLRKHKNLIRYRCFLDHRFQCVIQPWLLSTVPKKGRIKLQRTLEQLAAQPRSEWSKPNAAFVKNHIYVIRFKDENSTEHRIYGHFTDDSLCFVMTLTGIEKDNVFKPSNYAELAIANKRVCDQDFPTRTEPCFQLAQHRAEPDAYLLSSN